MTQPLTALRGTLDVALLPGNGQADMEEALRAASGIAQRLSDDLELLKEAVESGDPGDLAEDVSWPELIRRAVAQNVDERANRRISISFPKVGNCLVHVNPERLLNATGACLRLALGASPAGSRIEALLARQGRQLILTVSYNLVHPATAQHEGRSPDSIPEQEPRVWILNRTVEAQRGSFWAGSPSPGKMSLCIRLPLRANPKHGQRKQTLCV